MSENPERVLREYEELHKKFIHAANHLERVMATIEDDIKALSDKVDANTAAIAGVSKAEDLTPVTAAIASLTTTVAGLATTVNAIAAKLPIDVPGAAPVVNS